MANAYIPATNVGSAAYGQALSLLVQMLVSAGWTYQASGDGVGNWTIGGSIFSNSGSGAFGWNNKWAWARIQDPAGVREFIFQHDAAGGARIKYSPSAKFISSSFYGLSPFSAPGAADEKILRGGNTSATITLTLANPTVISWAAHGLTANAPVVFTTTGALPSTIGAGVTYYVSAAGLVAGAFQISNTPGGASTSTLGSSQSGTHTGTTPSFGAAWFAVATAINYYGAALAAAPYGFWYAGSTASVIKTGMMFDPVTSPPEDPDPCVLHIGSTNAYQVNASSLGRDGGNSATWLVTSGGTTEGCFAVMDTTRTSFSYVQPAGYAAQSTSQASGLVISGTGLAANPFNGKQDLMPMLYLRLQQSTTTVIPGIKGWSSLGRWTTVSRSSLLDTLSSRTWICVGAMWLPWDGVTPPLG